jgi:hypothetical protein
VLGLVTLTAITLGTAPASPAPVASNEPAGAVALSDQHAIVDSSGPSEVLRLTARVKSKLPVPVRAVRVGVLFAADAQALATADPSALYKRGRAEEGEPIGVIQANAGVTVAPRGEGKLELSATLKQGGPVAQAFVTHVLGYELGGLSAGLLFDLLSTQAACDEVAAVDALGLGAARPEPLAARQRWAAERAQLVPALARELERRIPERPVESETFRRVYAARALGVLGGPAAEHALRKLLRDPDLARFDEPLQILRIARVIGSRLETPLAYAVPAQAQHMRDVLAAALEDCTSLAADKPSSPSGGLAKPAGGALAAGAVLRAGPPAGVSPRSADGTLSAGPPSSPAPSGLRAKARLWWLVLPALMAAAAGTWGAKVFLDRARRSRRDASAPPEEQS